MKLATREQNTLFCFCSKRTLGASNYSAAGHTTHTVQSRELTTRTSSLMAIVEFPMLRAHSIYTRPRTSPPFFLFSFSPLHTTHSSKPEEKCQNLRNSQSHLSMKISTANTKKKTENIRTTMAHRPWTVAPQ